MQLCRINQFKTASLLIHLLCYHEFCCWAARVLSMHQWQKKSRLQHHAQVLSYFPIQARQTFYLLYGTLPLLVLFLNLIQIQLKLLSIIPALNTRSSRILYHRPPGTFLCLCNVCNVLFLKRFRKFQQSVKRFQSSNQLICQKCFQHFCKPH